jgi:hypothetical protein
MRFSGGASQADGNKIGHFFRLVTFIAILYGDQLNISFGPKDDLSASVNARQVVQKLQRPN